MIRNYKIDKLIEDLTMMASTPPLNILGGESSFANYAGHRNVGPAGLDTSDLDRSSHTVPTDVMVQAAKYLENELAPDFAVSITQAESDESESTITVENTKGEKVILSNRGFANVYTSVGEYCVPVRFNSHVSADRIVGEITDTVKKYIK